MTKERIPLIHIGYPKTGSTTIQVHLFANHPQIFNVAKPTWCGDRRIIDLFLCVQDQDGIEYDGQACRRDYEELILSRLPDDQVLVISQELFAAAHHADRSLIARRLFDLVGPAKVLIVVRQQLEYIESIYRHQYWSGKTNYRLNDWITNHIGNNCNGFMHHLKYERIAEYYADLFGRDNVCVALFEDLRDDGAGFGRMVSEMIDIDADEGSRLMTDQQENARRTSVQVGYSRMRRMIFPNVALGAMLPKAAGDFARGLLRAGPAYRIEIPADLRDRVADYYRTGNRQLAENWNLPLREHDYPL